MSKAKGGPNFHSARQNKGHPRREARRQRALERLTQHVCGPTCKAQRRSAVR